MIVATYLVPIFFTLQIHFTHYFRSWAASRGHHGAAPFVALLPEIKCNVTVVLGSDAPCAVSWHTCLTLPFLIPFHFSCLCSLCFMYMSSYHELHFMYLSPFIVCSPLEDKSSVATALNVICFLCPFLSSVCSQLYSVILFYSPALSCAYLLHPITLVIKF